jgi:hypothetical protein
LLLVFQPPLPNPRKQSPWPGWHRRSCSLFLFSAPNLRASIRSPAGIALSRKIVIRLKTAFPSKRFVVPVAGLFAILMTSFSCVVVRSG